MEGSGTGLFDKRKGAIQDKVKEAADEARGGAVSEAEEVKDQIDEAKEDLDETRADLEEARKRITGKDDSED